MATKSLPPAEYLRQCLRYDEATGELFWRERPDSHFRDKAYAAAWNTKWAGRIVGAPSRGYLRFEMVVAGARYRVTNSRVIYKIMTGIEPPAMVDHRNRDSHDNRRLNLRPCTDSQNQAKTPSAGPASRGRKVFLLTRAGSWCARTTRANARFWAASTAPLKPTPFTAPGRGPSTANSSTPAPPNRRFSTSPLVPSPAPPYHAAMPKTRRVRFASRHQHSPLLTALTIAGGAVAAWAAISAAAWSVL